MRILAFILVLCISFRSFGQVPTPCDSILVQELDLKPYTKEKQQKLLENLSALKQCGLDDMDITFISNPPILGSMLFKIATAKGQDKKLTYQKLYDKLIALKKTETYQKAIEQMRLTKAFSTRPADLSKWEQDKILLQQLVPDTDAVNRFYNYLKTHADPDKTYGDLYIGFTKIEKKKLQDEMEQYGGLFKNAGNVNYEDLLKKASAQQKPLLLYFAAHLGVNCRRIESSIKEHPSIPKRLMRDFYFVTLYADNNNTLPEQEWTTSKTNGRIIKRIGQKHLALQLNTFQTNTQPYFILIDKKGRKIAEQHYTNDLKEFETFLDTIK